MTVAAQSAASSFLSKQSSTKKPAQNPVIDSVMHLQRTIGNRAVSGLLQSGRLQTKLAIGQPGDKYEREADTVAQRVVSMPESTVQRATDDKKKEIQKAPLVSGITPLVQSAVDEKKELQKTPVGDDKKEQGIQRTPVADDKEKEPGIKRKAVDDKKEDALQKKEGAGNTSSMSTTATGHVESTINSSKGGGHPLSENDRSYFEPRFGTSFEDVRLHTDTQAAQVSGDLNAQAFTVGKDVFFGAGKFDTGSGAGKRLMAHELTHVVQQMNSKTKALNQKTIQKQDKKDLKSDNEQKDVLLDIGIALSQNNGKITSAIRNQIAAYRTQLIAKIRGYNNDQLKNELKKTWDSFLMSKGGNDAQFYMLSIKLSIFIEQASSRNSRSFESSENLSASIGLNKHEFDNIKEEPCLDAFYSNLAKLYPDSLPEKNDKTKEVANILKVKNALLELHYPPSNKEWVAESTLITKLNGQLDASTVKATLQIMVDLNEPMVENRKNSEWKSTKKFGLGMLTSTMTELSKEGIANEGIVIPFMRNPGKNKQKEKTPQACQRTANKIWLTISDTAAKARSGNYFFALSLHMDYHCVILNVQVKNGKMNVRWIDQEGAQKIGSASNLSQKIVYFMPNYWPEYSTLWQFYPSNSTSTVADRIEGFGSLMQTVRKIASQDN
jgi:hypothetical protein